MRETSRVAAFFDMDRALLDVSSGRLYMQALIHMGRISWKERLEMLWWAVLYGLGRLDLGNLTSTMIQRHHMNEPIEALWELTQRWFKSMVVPHISDKGKQKVEEHRRQGHRLAIISASTEFAVRALAEYLGGLDVLATRLVVRNGHVTGEIVPPFCYGKGKVYWAEQYAREHGIDLSQSWFYTDSSSDLPLLERVGHPVAVNPDRRLRRIARQRGWPIEEWK